MNLIERWKNRETKQKLKEENIRLKAEIEALHKTQKPPVFTVERNVQKVMSQISFSCPLPTEFVKEELCQNLVDCIKPFVEYDFETERNGNQTFKAILYVATGDRKYEHN